MSTVSSETPHTHCPPSDLLSRTILSQFDMYDGFVWKIWFDFVDILAQNTGWALRSHLTLDQLGMPLALCMSAPRVRDRPRFVSCDVIK